MEHDKTKVIHHHEGVAYGMGKEFDYKEAYERLVNGECMFELEDDEDDLAFNYVVGDELRYDVVGDLSSVSLEGSFILKKDSKFYAADELEVRKKEVKKEPLPSIEDCGDELVFKGSAYRVVEWSVEGLHGGVGARGSTLRLKLDRSKGKQ